MSLLSWAPVDSTDARERRELEEAAQAAAAGDELTHAVQCHNGWLGEDDEGRPIPCLRCRPSLARVACRTCQLPPDPCAEQLARRHGRCCVDCNHNPSTRHP
jgi:hypothetical protein